MTDPIRAEGRREHTTTLLPLILTGLSAAVITLAIFGLPGAATVSAANAADTMRGKDLFTKRCGGCHSLDADKEGPRLRNVYGRKAGTVPTFQYSDAMKAAGFVWDEKLLDRWLTETDALVRDNNMDFHVPKADERAAIIAFLKASSGK